MPTRPIRLSQELDQGDRNWLKDGKVTLVRAPTTEECFRLLDSGTVEGVVEAELVGRASLNALGMADRVQSIEPPARSYEPPCRDLQVASGSTHDSLLHQYFSGQASRQRRV